MTTLRQKACTRRHTPSVVSPKKSPSGIRTGRTDVALVARRLRVAQRDYEAMYGKAKR
jgi:hypothetical protein